MPSCPQRCVSDRRCSTTPSRSSARSTGEASQYFSRPAVQTCGAFAVEDSRAIHPHPVHAERVAQHAGAAAWKVLHPLEGRNTDSRRVEENEIRKKTGSNEAAL